MASVRRVGHLTDLPRIVLLPTHPAALPAVVCAEQRGGAAAQAHPAGERGLRGGRRLAPARCVGSTWPLHACLPACRPPRRTQVFVRMPLMHSEVLADQNVRPLCLLGRGRVSTRMAWLLAVGACGCCTAVARAAIALLIAAYYMVASPCRRSVWSRSSSWPRSARRRGGARWLACAGWVGAR